MHFLNILEIKKNIENIVDMWQMSGKPWRDEAWFYVTSWLSDSLYYYNIVKIRQGSARPQSLDPCLELTLKLFFFLQNELLSLHQEYK